MAAAVPPSELETIAQYYSKRLAHPASRSDLFDYTTIPLATVLATTREVAVPPAFDLIICDFCVSK